MLLCFSARVIIHILWIPSKGKRPIDSFFFSPPMKMAQPILYEWRKSNSVHSIIKSRNLESRSVQLRFAWHLLGTHQNLEDNPKRTLFGFRPAITSFRLLKARKVSIRVHPNSTMKLILASVLLMGILPVPSCGFLSRESTLKNQIIARHQELSNCIAFATSHPEYNFEEDESAAIISDEGDYFAVTLPKEDPETSQSPSQRPEYGALSRGTVVQVQVGDVSLARKAWKKRRRTGSPLLVPCSVLNADRQSMVRWNLSFLLEKFGKSQKDGIQISSSELSNKYRTFLKSSLSVSFNVFEKWRYLCMFKALSNSRPIFRNKRMH